MVKNFIFKLYLIILLNYKPILIFIPGILPPRNKPPGNRPPGNKLPPLPPLLNEFIQLKPVLDDKMLVPSMFNLQLECALSR